MLSDDELDNLSDEELIAISQELDMDSLKPAEEVAVEQPSDLDAMSNDDLFKEASILGIETDNGLATGEAMARGVAQALTLGMHDEMTGVIEALKRKIINNDEADFMDLYTQERDAIRGKNQYAEKADPSQYLLGSLAGSVPLGAFKALQGMSGAVVTGGLAGVGFGEQEDLADVALDASLGSAFGGVFEYAGQVASSKFKSLLNRSKGNPLKKVMAQKAQSPFPEDKVFAEASLSEIVGENVVDMDSYVMTSAARTRARKIPKKIISTVDNAFALEKTKLAALTEAAQIEAGDIRFNFSKEFKELDSVVSSMPGIGNQKSAVSQIKNKVLEPLRKAGQLDGEDLDLNNLSLSQFHKIGQKINHFRYQADDQGRALSHLDPDADQALAYFAGALTDRYNNAHPKLKEVNEKWTSFYRMSAVKPTQEAHVPYLLDNLQTSKTAINGQLFLEEAFNHDQDLAKALYNSIDSDLKFREIVTTADSMKVGIGPIFQISAGAGMGGALGAYVGDEPGAVAGSVLGAAVSIAGPERRVLAHTVTKAVRDAFKIPRKMSGILKNADVIQSKISNIQGSTAGIAFANAVAERDTKTIESMVSTALQNPKIAKEFEPGVGFEGKIMTLEEANQLKAEVFSSNIPPREQMQMINQINNGMIPQPQQPRQPFVKRYQARNRDENGRKI